MAPQHKRWNVCLYALLHIAYSVLLLGPWKKDPAYTFTTLYYPDLTRCLKLDWILLLDMDHRMGMCPG